MAVGILGWLLLACLHVVAASSNRIVVERGLTPLQRLAHNIETLTNRTIRLEHNGEKLAHSLSHRQDQLDTASASLLVNSQTLTNMTQGLTAGGRQMDSLSTLLHARFPDITSHVAKAEQPVAFSVRFKNDSVGDDTPDKSPVLFDMVQFNTGGGNYSNSTGQYTAPSDGTYAFFFTIQRVDPSINQCLEVVLYRNGRAWTSCLASACPPGYSAASNLCMMWMRKGDTMHAMTWMSNQIFGYLHTTFSGFKLN